MGQVVQGITSLGACFVLFLDGFQVVLLSFLEGLDLGVRNGDAHLLGVHEDGLEADALAVESAVGDVVVGGRVLHELFNGRF